MMMCIFQSLYFSEDGYVIRCKQCGYYQLAFGSTMLRLTGQEFVQLYKMVQNKCIQEDVTFILDTKNIMITTPAQRVYILLTKKEAIRFSEILEEADSEEKALLLINLFNPL